MVFLWLPQCWGVPVKQLGFSHICSLFRARLCWGGGSVANMGLVSLYWRGL